MTEGAATEAPASESFVGRERELALMRDAVEQARSGATSIVLLAGDPGIGKTRLAAEAASYAASTGFAVSWGRAWEAGGAPPYWPWTRALRDVVGHVAPAVVDGAAASAPRLSVILPELVTAAPAPASVAADVAADERFALFDAVARLVTDITRERPLLLVLDDLHAVDEPTLLLLHFLARDIRNAALVVIGTYRDAEARRNERVGGRLIDIAREGLLLELDGLPEGAVARFVATYTGTEPNEGAVRDLCDATGGNPLFVHEILRLREGRDAAGRGRPADVPATVRETVRGRLALLPASTMHVLATAAVYGREADPATLGRILDRPMVEIQEDLEPAVRSGLLVPAPRGGGLAFSHGLIRETVYDDIRAGDRARLHARILEILEGHDPADRDHFLSELAHHAVEAATAGADRAIDYARRAAELAAEQLAFEEAVRHYELALRAADVTAAPARTQLDLLLALAGARAAAGEIARSREDVAAAMELARKLGSWQGMAAAALLYPSTTRAVWHADETLMGILREALAVVPPDAHSERARLLSRLALEGYYSKEPLEDLAHEAIEEARAAGDHAALAASLLGLYYTRIGTPTGPEVPELDEALALAEELGDPHLISTIRWTRLVRLFEIGPTGELDSEAAAFTALSERTRRPIDLWWTKIMHAARAIYEGRYDEGEKLTTEAVAYGYRFVGEQALSIFGVQDSLLRVDRESWAAVLPSLLALPDEFKQRIPVRAGIAFGQAATGDREAAARELEALAANDYGSVPRDRSRLSTLAQLAEVAILLGDERRCAELLAFMDRYAGRLVAAGTFGVWGPFDLYRGRLLHVLGRLDEAEAALRAAVDLADATRGRPAGAKARHALGRVLIDRGATDEAQALFEDALAVASDLGMTELETAARADLQRLDRPRPGARAVGTGASAVLRHEGEYWAVVGPSGETRLRDTKGLRYLAQLLTQPGAEIHVMELATAIPTTLTPSRPEGLPGDGFADLGPVLDVRAKAEYRRRIDDLRSEIDEASAFNDPERASRAQAELDFLIAELSRAVGLGGRDRKAVSATERARVNVTKAIRSAVRRLADHEPELADELERCLATGMFCSYRPLVGTTTWRVIA